MDNLTAGMTWVDWAIVIAIAAAVLSGLSQGFLRSACSLLGLLLGLALAAWNYIWVGAMLKPFIKVVEVADVAAFLLIAALVMVVASLVGSILAKTFQKIGLGWLDRLAGGAFGLLQGVVLVAIVILVTVAFLPDSHWLMDAKLPRHFFGMCHLSTRISPDELGLRVRMGLKFLQQGTPEWMHSHTGNSYFF
jgi:membrane protein required for colicin V production